VNIAIIPARGGSKRIERKNVRLFCGKPMLAWSIEALRDSGCVDRIVVSTDDEEIAQTARSLGAEVPFARPRALADDHTATLPVIAHAVHALRDLGWTVERVCCVYATAPLLEPDDLRRSLDLLAGSAAQYVFSCTTFAFPIQRALRRSVGGGIEPIYPELIQQRSQDLPEAFHDAGQFYWGTADAFAGQKPIFASHSHPYLIPHDRVQDIDTEADWRRAEILFRCLKEPTA
jgi:pseudaminic acid cytidylyltransferase